MPDFSGTAQCTTVPPSRPVPTSNEAPIMRANTETVLQAGMVVTVEPGIYLPGFAGVRIDDLGRGGDGALDHGLRVRLALPAVGDNENLGYGKGKLRHRSGISVAAGNRLRRALGERFSHQGLPVAGRCGTPS